MNDRTHSQDALLDRAIASLRDADIPAGPGELLTQRTLEALDVQIRDRWRFNKLLIGVGVAALIAFGFLIVRQVELSRETAREWDPQRLHIDTGAPNPSPTVVTSQPTTQVSPSPIAPPPSVLFASEISIRGRVFFHGPHPARRLIDTDSCPQCAQVTDGPLYDDSLVINDDGTLQNVVVSISAGLPADARFSIPPEPVVLNQKGCMFRPHVIATMVGQAIVVKNSDPLLHSVHSMDAEQSPAFDFAQPTLGSRRVEPLQVVETFQVKCDLHPWMSAWVRVFNHPYFAVTGADGSFTIPPLPPGTYRIKAWHELLGVREKMIEVREGAPANIDFTFDR
jgi:hypothetical protein